VIPVFFAPTVLFLLFHQILCAKGSVYESFFGNRILFGFGTGTAHFLKTLNRSGVLLCLPIVKTSSSSNLAPQVLH